MKERHLTQTASDSAAARDRNGKRSGSPITWAGPLFGALMVAGLVFLTLIVFAAEPSHVVFVRVGPTNIALFIADSDGNNERPVLPATSLALSRWRFASPKKLPLPQSL